MAQKVVKRKSRTRALHLPAKGLAAVVEAVSQSAERSGLPSFKAGDDIRIQVRIKEGEKERLQAFEGTVIAISNRGVGKSFTIRKVTHGVGVERIFLYSSPRIGKIEVIQQGRVRRAKMYYLRGLEGKAARIERDVAASNKTKEAAAAAAAAAK